MKAEDGGDKRARWPLAIIGELFAVEKEAGSIPTHPLAAPLAGRAMLRSWTEPRAPCFIAVSFVGAIRRSR